MRGRDGNVSVITGGVGGLGLEIAARLSARGDRVVLWDQDPNVAEVAKQFSGGFGVLVDLTDETSVTDAANSTLYEAGSVSVLVNSAGITGPNKTLADYSFADWRRVHAVNLDGVFLCCRAILPLMEAGKYGRIVNISSIAGKEGNPNASAYSSSKAGVIALTKSLAKEAVAHDIRVNCVTPATIDTPLLQQMSQEFIDYVLAKIPLGRLGRADEVAALVEWLASENCSFSTGAVFDISGGRATY
ncbi:SDR family oxidoreductase [Agrobacterium vitis]|uniref:SDR family NAD(P)-dependent oxidoreductase n=1 Tax=Agrobacterium vitis TaxID=373 RepID=UPI0012E8E49B|nr:SDR family NAD(P)-dependent oxidoreductase [Agrobacterium vitis]MVA22050.1 SDR family oxidoreductase [Agrobacterium vitis]